MGRMNLIKLNILPRLLYPMQMLPLYIAKKRVKEIERDFSKFICNGKKSGLNLKTSQLPKERGGVAFPNLIYYNWACHCDIIHDWVHSYLKGGPEPFEAWRCAPHALLAELTNIRKTTGKSHRRPFDDFKQLKSGKQCLVFFRGRNSRHI